mgnify:CR=1 FL=1
MVNWVRTYRASTFPEDTTLELNETAHLIRNKSVTETKKKKKKKKHISFLLSILQFKREVLDFPSGPVVKNPSPKAGDMGFIPGPGGSHMPRGN